MIERPILFSTDMVKAILSGNKTQTRRAVKNNPVDIGVVPRILGIENDWGKYYIDTEEGERKILDRLPYGNVGDILWVRETWQITSWTHPSDENYGYIYKASENGQEWERNSEQWRWKPSIFMPKEACRIRLRIKDVRVERLQDISEEDAIAEGIESWTENRLKSKPIRYKVYDDDDYEAFFTSDPVDSFRGLWEKINGTWESNPWVWVIEFEKV